MSVAASASESGPTAAATDPLAQIRAVGGLDAHFVPSSLDGDGTTRLASLFESGGYRLKFPDTSGHCREAVIVNTGGGVAGGDRVSMRMRCEHGSKAVVSTATAERIYRSSAAPSEVEVRLATSGMSTLAWLPQATILFSGARLHRRIEADIASQARLIVAETTVFGRTASGEELHSGELRENWHIRRDGRLVFAEATRLDGAIAAKLDRPAVANGMRVVALLVCIAPDVEERIDAVREVLDATTRNRSQRRNSLESSAHHRMSESNGSRFQARDANRCGHPSEAEPTLRSDESEAEPARGQDVVAGVSAWNEMLVVRLLATRLDAAEVSLSGVLSALNLCPSPRAWPTPLQ